MIKANINTSLSASDLYCSNKETLSKNINDISKTLENVLCELSINRQREEDVYIESIEAQICNVLDIIEKI